MKKLSVDMPLAVPHQKPPNKYASHPYPVLTEEVMQMGFSMKGTGNLINMPFDSMHITCGISGKGELRSIRQTFNLTESGAVISAKIEGEGQLKGISSSVAMRSEKIIVNANIAGVGELKRVLIRQNALDELKIGVKITGSGVLL